MKIYSLIVSDSAAANIYQLDLTKSGNINLIKNLTHTASRSKNLNLTTDRPGCAKRCSPLQKVALPATEPKAVEKEKFAKQIIKELLTGLHINLYANLIIVAEPKFMGILKKHFPKKLTHNLCYLIAKDLMATNTEQLATIVKSHIKPILLSGVVR